MAATTQKPKKIKRKKKEHAAQAPERQRFPKKVKNRQQTPKGERGGLRLLLVENVPHLGQQGDVVEVKPGFGRNYLIPQGLATYVTPQALVQIEKHRAKLEALHLAKIADLKVLAKKLEAHSITIEANANEDGHLYGSVTAQDIVGALRKEDFPIEESHVQLEGPIKELGLYQVALRLFEGIGTELKVWVVPAGARSDSGN